MGPENEKQVLIEAEQRLAQAHMDMDLAVIETLLHPDYVILQPGGALETKADVLASYRTGQRQWDLARSDQFDVRLYGAMALVLGRWQATGHNRGQPFDYTARFISVWICEDGVWRNVSYQSAELSD